MSSLLNVPIGPTIPRSSAFSDIVVGESCNDGKLVAYFHGTIRICGDIIVDDCLTAKCFKTNPGGAKLENTTLSGLSLPTNNNDAANKAYVDAVAQGLEIKEPVQVGTTTDIPLSGTPIVDGYQTVIGDRILIKDQVNGIENGLYEVSLGSWFRTSDLPTGSGASRTAVFIENGTINGGATYVCINDTPNDITGTDFLFFSLFTQSTGAGSGLTKTGNLLNVNVDDIGIEINGLNQLQLKDNGVTNNKLQYDYITINGGDGIFGGGTVTLGNTTSLNVDSTVLRTFGNQTKTGNLTITGDLTANKLSDGIIEISGGIISGVTNFTASGTITAGTFTDGTATLTGGNLTGLNLLSSTTITDGTWSTTAGVQTGAVSISTGTLSASGAIDAISFTDGTATLSGGTLTGLNLPTVGSDAANKTYVDSVSNGMKWKQPVRAGTTAPITLSGIQVIDGVSMIAGNRILVKDQLLPIQNGIYIVSAGAWSRSTDMPTGYSSSGSVVWIEEGSTQAETGWVITNDQGSDVIGTDPITWLKWSGTGLVVAGDGLSKVGDVLNVNVDNSTIEIVLDNLQVKPLGITSSQLASNAVTTLKIQNLNVTNAKLQNSSLTITPGDGLQNGGIVSLGSSTSLAVDSTVVRTSGAQTISDLKTFTTGIAFRETGGGSDTVTIQAPNSLTTDYTLTLPINTGSSGEVLTTDGSGNLSWSAGSGTNDQLFYGYDSVGGVNVLNTSQTLIINTNVINDPEYSNVLGVITITNSGIYEISYWVQFETTTAAGGTRATFGSQLELNSVLVPGSRSSCFIREQNNQNVSPGSGKTVYVSVTALDNIKITFLRQRGTTFGRTKSGESSITIKRLR